MAGTIVPMVHGKSVAIRCWTICLYILSSAVGGGVIGALFGFIGSCFGPILSAGIPMSSALLGWTCVLASFHEAKLLTVPFPQFHRQVPQRWRRLGCGSVVLYGSVLGFGIGTRINTATHCALMLGVAFEGNALTGALVMAVFGVARALPACSLSFLSLGRATGFLAPAISTEEIMHLMNAVILIGCGMRLLSSWI